ncbi:IS3 family transposase [Alkaliphilus sp. B6464]|uniref:IS3 family transposase n=1 Tax=Alkaliphilus sp. B6464 TaxID=2731219 RepID=UPI001BA78BF3|nr:IS3 family transposase [Alkaliphilus sp. B6464]
MKTELLIDGKFYTIQKAKNAVFEYIEMFYNTKRLHSSLGYNITIIFVPTPIVLFTSIVPP